MLKRDNSVINRLTEEQVLTVSKKIRVDERSLIINGTPNKKNSRFSYRLFSVNSNTKVLGHHVLWKQAHPQSFLHQDMYLSHLCGNSSCGDPHHIHQESRNMNESRKYCHNGTWDSSLCPHSPPCLFITH